MGGEPHNDEVESSFRVIATRSAPGWGTAYAFLTRGSWDEGHKLFVECLAALPAEAGRWSCVAQRFYTSRLSADAESVLRSLEHYASEWFQGELDAAFARRSGSSSTASPFSAPYVMSDIDKEQCGLWLRDVFGMTTLVRWRKSTSCEAFGRFVARLSKLDEIYRESLE